MRLHPVATLLSFLLAQAFGCGHSPSRRDAGVDAGAATDAGVYDPILGNPFEGPIALSDDRVAAIDPATLQGTAAPCRAPVLARITRIVDGDTVYANGISESLSTSVRMIGVDTPEIGRGGAADECYAGEATDFTAQLNGRTVWLTFDRTCLDPYDRLLAYVWVGAGPQDLWERQLLERGLGTVLVIRPNNTFEDVFNQDAFLARRDGLGLWSACP